ncbi:96 kDa nucleoporin-interacting component [Suhomyces tanzawaensis NRRL Y-17324]|uniref:Nuclear pore protein n=1 Tax=Suhomyces tanzawaensis NRRL Y-17324 TaxID=984487 RepID=A0A1E4SJP3_9ASCO|nr:96 kDa nucleoporin-interacting component [Suhomyces tanzawaensis NRRL Y-17324]ODV79710.1 96 kDa nucleoporin-interacting component [Suhomyces tanzawaensis NRRL Y-17324]
MSLFGQNNTQALNTASSTGFGAGFGALIQSNNTSTAPAKPGLSQTNPSTSTTLPTSINSGSSSKLLKDLLESAHNLPKSDNLELGSIHLTLNELQRKSQLLRKNDGSKDVNYTKAHYLLASSGINAEEIENELGSIQLPPPTDASASTSAHLTSHGATSLSPYDNLENYLVSKKNENILNTIEQSLTLASKDFDNFISSNISIDWKVRRDELRKSIGLRTNGNNTPQALKDSITWNQSVPGTYSMLAPINSKGSASVKQISRDKFENHAKIIYQLNEARSESSNFLYGLNLIELSKFQNDLKSKQTAEVWKILIDLTNEKFSKTNQEQKYFQSYQGSNDDELSSLHRKIINNSKAYLENEFYNYIEQLYLKDSKKSPQFTPATNLNKISFFIEKIILKNDSELLSKTLNVNNTPVWALLFYLIRAGLYNDALEFTLKNKDVFNKFDSNFPVYLKKFVESENHVIPSELNQRLRAEFTQQFQFYINDSTTGNVDGKFDAYKYSVYKIIGKCDLNKKSLPQSINLSIEDWLWFHLSIINENQFNNESPLVFENYSLVNLQHKIISLGPKNFNTSSNNPLYLKTLILVGLYELGVQYAYEQINECDAVHLAIGLNYYGLLKTPSFSNKDELLVIHNNEYMINFSRLIGSYTRTFKISDPKVACQYLILIALSKGGSSREELDKCHEALRELILVSREFGMLLGELNSSNGVRVPGILERQRSLIGLESLDSYYKQIIEISAIKCEEDGRIFDALLLYQLCQEYDTVISLVNKLLAEILSSTELDKPIVEFGNYEIFNGFNDGSNGNNQPRTDTVDNNIILLARQSMEIFKNNGVIMQKIGPQIKDTCDLLLSVIDIRDIFLRRDWNRVINEIAKLGLIPIDANDDLVKIRKLTELIQTNHMDDNLIKIIPSLLIMIMSAISQLNYEILTRRYQALGNEREELARLKQIAKNCMIYAGMVQYKMPRETYSLLINLESLL